MIPEIRRHVRSTLRGKEPRSLDQFVSGVVANASDIFGGLAERGLKELAYPRPLAMAALVRVKQAEC
jgi:hypothetical protein